MTERDYYSETIDRLEKDITKSIAISLKRIADHLEGKHWPQEITVRTQNGGSSTFFRVDNTNEYRCAGWPDERTRIFL